MRKPRPYLITHALALACGLLFCACQGSGATLSPGNLLHAKRPLEARGVKHAARLTDGVTPSDGDAWLTDLSVVFTKPDGYVIYDLGRSMPIDAALIAGDNNDRFVLAVSDDDRNYREIWRAPTVPGAGMRLRWRAGFATQGRFLRVSALGGDRSVSAGELMLFSHKPDVWPPHLRQRPGLMPLEEAQRWLVGLGVALLLVLGCSERRVPRWVLAIVVLGAAAVGVRCAAQIAELWPPDIGVGELARAVIAAVAMLTLLVLSVRRYARPWVVKGLLFTLALLGAACFYNFGGSWFWNAEAARLTPVHTYDMRVYFPVAKYFRELHFDGVYLASIEAYLEDGQRSDSSVKDVELRNLRTNLMVRAADVMPEIHAVKSRFSPERWQAFVRDMRFFMRTMGSGDYLGSLGDHGGNATPVWIALAHLLFAKVVASERALTLAALLDPLLLLLTFVCIWRSFGLRAMLVCAIVFGTTDFPMFGSNWAGSTLRFDWMATAGLGACALRTGRYALAGALLAHAGLVRAFPLLALLFTPIPAVLYAGEGLWRRRRLLISELRAQHRGLERLLLSAMATIAVLVGLSIALFGFRPAWVGWAQRIVVHTEDANTNHLGVRTVMAFDPDLTTGDFADAHAADPWAEWQRTQLQTYEKHKVGAFALRVIFSALCLLACRRARPEQAALLGLMLIPVFTYPANYYCHYVFLLPLLAVDQRPWLALWIELVLLLMCLLEYFTLDNWVDLRFFWESVILLAGYAAILLPLAFTAAFGTRASSTPGTPNVAPA